MKTLFLMLDVLWDGWVLTLRSLIVALVLIGLLTPSVFLSDFIGAFFGGLWQVAAIFAFIGWFMYACAIKHREQPWEYEEDDVEWVGDAHHKFRVEADGKTFTYDKPPLATRKELPVFMYGDDVR